MSREVIHKAKRLDNNKWIKGYYYKSWKENEAGMKYDLHYIHNYEDNKSYLIDISTLSQFIGKYDKNNEEIYENDVIRTSNGFELQIVWSDEFCEFMYKNLNKGYDFMIGMISELSSFTRDKEIEVIGNIFNRELKKVS